MTEELNGEKAKSKPGPLFLLRIIIGSLMVLLALAYAVAIISGHIPESNRIDTVTLAVIAMAFIAFFLLISPGALNRLKKFEAHGIKLEMLEAVKEKQAEQEIRLDDIALVLPLLLPKAERKHLLNLDSNKTADYVGGHSVRSELRRLRTVGLIKSISGTHIAQIADGTKVDISKFLELTVLGKRWVKKIREIEQAEMNDTK